MPRPSCQLTALAPWPLARGRRAAGLSAGALALLIGLAGCGGGGSSSDVDEHDATLAALTLSNGTLSPAFSATRTTYQVTVDDASLPLGIDALASEERAVVSIGGTTSRGGRATATRQVGAGDTALTIIVIAPDGVTGRSYGLTLKAAGANR